MIRFSLTKVASLESPFISKACTRTVAELTAKHHHSYGYTISALCGNAGTFGKAAYLWESSGIILILKKIGSLTT